MSAATNDFLTSVGKSENDNAFLNYNMKKKKMSNLEYKVNSNNYENQKLGIQINYNDGLNKDNIYINSNYTMNDTNGIVGLAKDEQLIEFKKNFRTDKVACIGAGYVGGPTMATIAYYCPHIQVHVLDISEERISSWNDDNNLPIYEPGLADVLKVCRGRNLHFSTDIAMGIKECDIIFICVNTPTKTFGIGAGAASEMSNWELAARTIASNALSNKIIVEKSTIPVRTAEALTAILQHNKHNVRFCILSNPEFLAEGTAMADLAYPERVLIGGALNTAIGNFAVNVLMDIYANWVNRNKIITTKLWSAELTKLVANAFLAQRISSINSISLLCERVGADISEVSKSVGLDSRIGRKFLNASVGFGGSCFKKDLLSLVYLCKSFGLEEVSEYWMQVIKINEHQKSNFASRVVDLMYHTVKGKKIAVFGFAFKKDTGDTRETPAVDVCMSLIKEGACLHIFDPKVTEKQMMEEFRKIKHFEDNFEKYSLLTIYSRRPYDSVKDSHAILILTEWEEFTKYDYKFFFDSMKKPAFIFDGRNILHHQTLWRIGYNVYSIGKVSLVQDNEYSLEMGITY